MIKKVLIYFVMLMDVVKTYINNKTEKIIFSSNISTVTHNENKKIINKFIKQDQFKEVQKQKFKIDRDLLKLSLTQLLGLLDIRNFPIFIVLSNLFIMKSVPSKMATITLDNKNYSFSVTFEEQQHIMCSKIKRKDELIKFSYRFIRKQIFKRFKEKMISERKMSKLKDIRNEFKRFF